MHEIIERQNLKDRQQKALADRQIRQGLTQRAERIMSQVALDINLKNLKADDVSVKPLTDGADVAFILIDRTGETDINIGVTAYVSYQLIVEPPSYEDGYCYHYGDIQIENIKVKEFDYTVFDGSDETDYKSNALEKEVKEWVSDCVENKMDYQALFRAMRDYDYA